MLMAQNAAVFLISFVRYRKGLQRLRRTCQRRRRSWLRTGFLGLIGLLAAAPTPAQWRSVVTFTLNDGPHIAFLDGNQHLRQIWYNTAYNIWFGQDLTAASNGTPAAAGSALASWIQSDGPHIAYLDTGGHVHQLWYTISTGVWNHQDLSATTNASTAEAGTPLNIFSGPDGDHIFYLDTNQHLDQIWWMNTQWIWQDLMADVSGVHLPSATSGLANFTLDGSIPQIVFIDQVGDLEQRWWQNNQFVQQDLTATVLASPASSSSALASWMQSDGPHIAYLDTGGHVHQLWYTISTGVWNHQDLSATTNASTAEAGTPLNIFSGPDGDHIFYLDTNQHLDQIWWMNTQWIWQDLMADVSGVHLPSATSGLANFTLDGSIPQIVFIDQVGDLEQRWWQNNQFVQQDLTALLVTNFSISGQVTTLGSPLSGVNMMLSGSASGGTTTDANGNYSFTVQYGGTYTVTPSLSGYNFSPASLTFSYLNSNQVANFSGTIPGGPGTQPNAAREFIRFNGQVVVVENGH